MNSTVKTVLFWLLIGVSALLLWQVVKSAREGQKDQELKTSQFMNEVEQNNVQEFTVNGMEVRGKLRNGSVFHSTAPGTYFTPEMLKSLDSKGVNVDFRDINGGNWAWMIQVIPIVLIGARLDFHDPADADRRE